MTWLGRAAVALLIWTPSMSTTMSITTIGTTLLFSSWGGGCAASRRPMHPQKEPGQWYAVENGESLGEIANRAGVPEEDLLEVNGLRSGADVGPGSLIFVLDGSRGRVELSRTLGGSATPGSATTGDRAGGGLQDRDGDGDGAADGDRRTREAALAAGNPGNGKLRWPIDAPRVTSYFGNRWGRSHEGIDLIAAVGTPVLAAGPGEVIYAGNRLRGYGNMVVIRHRDDLMTVYAHNSVVLVKVGQRVTIGQRVALSGQSGHATGPHLHFEVRRGQIPRDPMPFLPNLPGRSPKS